jgi:hypothetical protein
MTTVMNWENKLVCCATNVGMFDCSGYCSTPSNNGFYNVLIFDALPCSCEINFYFFSYIFNSSEESMCWLQRLFSYFDRLLFRYESFWLGLSFFFLSFWCFYFISTIFHCTLFAQVLQLTSNLKFWLMLKEFKEFSYPARCLSHFEPKSCCIYLKTRRLTMFQSSWHNTYKKYRVLQLGLQLGFLVAMDTCNSWYLYGLEC